MAKIDERILNDFMTPRATTGGGHRFRSPKSISHSLGLSVTTVENRLSRMVIKRQVVRVTLEMAQLAGFKTTGNRYGITGKGMAVIGKRGL